MIDYETGAVLDPKARATAEVVKRHTVDIQRALYRHNALLALLKKRIA